MHRMSHRICAFWLMVSLLLGFGATGAVLAEGTANSGNAASSIEPVNRGILWRVEHDGHAAYLFGTIHVGQASFYPLEPVVQRALAGADSLEVELDIRDQPPLKAAVEKYGVLTAPQTIDQVISADTFKQLQDACTSLGVPLKGIARLKPWTVSNVLLALSLERAGFARDQGVEVALLAQAKALGKPVVSLETADYQIGLFDTLDAAQQEQYLRETLQAIKSGKFKREGQQLLDAWGRADSATLEQLMLTEMAAPTVTADFTRRVLLEQRNPGLAQSIQNLIDRQQSSFVAIGLLHLVGADSVPKILERHGYQVQKLY